jgi:hypothetical protein
VRDTSRTPTQALVAGFVDYHRAVTGVPPARSVVGQIARHVGELARQYDDADLIAVALELLVDKRLHPSTLPTLIGEAAAGPGVATSRRPASPVDELYRRVLARRNGEEGS